MFNKSLEEQKREHRRIMKGYRRAVRNRRYSGWDVGDTTPKTTTYHGVDYYIEPVCYTVVDDYDEYIESVELSHKESLGYSVVSSYDGEPEVLDFRFVKAQDSISLRLGNSVKEIYLNSVNIRYTSFHGNQTCKYNITINSDIVDFSISLMHFLKKNKATIESISFQDVNNLVMAKIIKRICDTNEIYNISFVNKNIESTDEDKNDHPKVKRYSK